MKQRKESECVSFERVKTQRHRARAYFLLSLSLFWRRNDGARKQTSLAPRGGAKCNADAQNESQRENKKPFHHSSRECTQKREKTTTKQRKRL
jgi:hypothetical protein